MHLIFSNHTGFRAAMLFFVLASALWGNLEPAGMVDPYRLRAQLTEEATQTMRSTGRLPNVISVGPTQTGIPNLDRLNESYGAVSIRQVFHPRPGYEERHREHGLDRWVEITFRQPHFMNELASLYGQDPDVQWAEPVFRKRNVSEESFPNDERYPQQWALRNTGQGGGTPGADISAHPAWDLETGNESVIVLVVDSGIDVSHSDLAGSLWENPNAGMANGYLGDLHGWNFAEDSAQIQDTSGHGTQVSGILAAKTHNYIGIAGVAGGSGNDDGVRLMIARTFAGQNVGGFAEALVYGADNGAVIASNSWGYVDPGVFEQVVLDAIDYFVTYAGFDEEGQPVGPLQGGLVVFAAGNSNNDDLYYPAAYEGAMAIAATNRNDQKSNLSSYGTWIDLAAPGASIISTHIGNGYRTVSGTSFAAPHVSGVAALLVSRFPGLTPDIVWKRLVQTADDLDALNPDYAGLLGTGRLNAFRALNDYGDSAPAAVTDLQVVDVEQDRVALEWTAPGSSGQEGQALRYDVRFSSELIDESNFSGATPLPVGFFPAESGSLEIIGVEGLSADTEYWFALKSRDVVGNWSELSNVVQVVTLSPPAVSLSPDELEFHLEIGETDQAEVTIGNYGQGPLTIQLIAESVPEWISFSGDHWVVEPQEEAGVTFSVNSGQLTNGIYSESILFVTNDPLQKEVALSVQLTVVGGDPEMQLSEDTVDFSTVFIGYPKVYELVISNVGTAELVIDGVVSSHPEILSDFSGFTLLPGESHTLALAWNPEEEEALEGVITILSEAISGGEQTVPMVGTSFFPPEATVSVEELMISLISGETLTQLLTIGNAGAHNLDYDIYWYGAPLPEGLAAPYGTSTLLTGSSGVSNPVDLVLDDGSMQNSIGLSAGGEFIWMNQFSPDPTLFPFVLKEIEIYFPTGGGMVAGDRVDIYVFKTFSDQPDEDAEFLQRLEGVPVANLNQWTIFPLDVPIYLGKEADIIIAVVNRELGKSGFPAAIDQSGPPAGRSWIGTYSGGSVPEYPFFPANGLWGKIDDLGFPGNWLIRGAGHRDFFRLDDTGGSIEPGQSGDIELLFDSSDLMEGTYEFYLEIVSNDPARSQMIIPISLEVSGVPVAALSDSGLDFGEVYLGTIKEKQFQLENQGTGTLQVLDYQWEGEVFFSDISLPLSIMPGDSQVITITFEPSDVVFYYEELILQTDDVASASLLIALEGEGVAPPAISVDAEPLEVTVTPYVGTTHSLTIENTGSGDLTYKVVRDYKPTLLHGMFSLMEEDVVDRGDFQSVEFTVDDGSAEDSIGLTGGGQFLWGNHFTPAEGEVPFFLDEIEVYFRADAGVSPGDALDIYLYSLPNKTPEFGGNLEMALRDAEVKETDGWSTYQLDDPLLVEGDIFIGIVLRQPDFFGWPAAIDMSSPSQERSWVGIYFDDPPEDPFLPASDFWGLIDDAGLPGNWLIRGRGQHALVSYSSGTGVIPEGASADVQLYFHGEHYDPGVYQFDLILQSNDPLQPEIVVPITVTVEEGLPILAGFPSEIDFGKSLVGVLHTRTILFENTGTGKAVLDSIGTADPAFAVGDWDSELLPGEESTLTLSFLPETTQSYSGQLTVESNNGDVSPLIIDIFGFGSASESLSEWMQRGNLTGDISDPAQNPLGEPISHLLRFALGVEPDQVATAYLPRMTSYSIGENNHPALYFSVSQTAEDVSYRLQVSYNLQDWNDVPDESLVIEVVSEDQFQQQAYWIDTTRTLGSQPLFYRLVVELD